MGTCIIPTGCTTGCLFTGKPCTRYGQPFTSLFRVEAWFHSVRGRKTLWRALQGEWVEIATSTSARVLADRFTTGSHIVMPAGIAPVTAPPLEVLHGALF